MLFNESQIRVLVLEEGFARNMRTKKKAAWFPFIVIVKNFHGKNKGGNPEVVIKKMLLSKYKDSFPLVTSLKFQITLKPLIMNNVSSSVKT